MSSFKSINFFANRHGAGSHHSTQGQRVGDDVAVFNDVIVPGGLAYAFASAASISWIPAEIACVIMALPLYPSVAMKFVEFIANNNDGVSVDTYQKVQLGIYTSIATLTYVF